MRQNVLINIRGTQQVEDEKDTTELFTLGSLYKKNNKVYIVYDETETTGFQNCRTTLKIDGEQSITMLRSGESRSQLVIERDKRNVGYYGLPEGELVIGVTAREIKARFDDQGGSLYCRYDLDVNAAVMSKNELFVDVKPNLPQK